MKVLPDIAVSALTLASQRELTREVHSEDKRVYDRGLSDGTQITAEYVLSQLQEVAAPQVVEEGLPKESD